MLNTCPLQFRFFCHLLQKETQKKFPDQSWPISTGGFFFLRYICPAIIAPENLIPEFATLAKGPNVRRTLVLLSKTIQNLANGTRFFKEPFMMSMVPWIDEHLPHCKRLFLKISTVPSDGVESPITPDQDIEESTEKLCEYLQSYRQEFLNNLKAQFNSSLTMRLNARVADQMQAIILQLGKPSTILVKENGAPLIQLRDLLVDDEQYTFAIALANMAQQTAPESKEKHDWSLRMAEALVTIFEAHHAKGAVPLLQEQFQQEDSDGPSMESSMFVKMTIAYGRLALRPYLASLLGPVIAPALYKNALQDAQLQDIIKTLNESLVYILKTCPKTLRHLLEYVQAQSNTKGHSFNLARFLLVSMIIPAIKAPLLFEVVRDPPKKEIQKNLDMLAKLLSAIADATTGESKSPRLINAHADFILTSAISLRPLADTNLSALPCYEGRSLAPSDVLQSAKERSLSTIYGFIYEHTAAITKAVGTKEKPLIVKYRNHEIFDILLDQPTANPSDKKKDKHKKVSALSVPSDAKKKFGRLFGS